MITSGGIENALRATSDIHEASHWSSNHKSWTLGWHIVCKLQQLWGIKEILANVLTQTRVSDVFIL